MYQNVYLTLRRTVKMITSHFDSCFCGFLGASASSIGKLAFASDISKHWLIKLLVPLDLDTGNYALLAVRGVLVALMVFLNGYMVNYFLKALENNSSISVTILSTACNIIASGVLGWCMYNEELSFNWIIGSLSMTIGIILIAWGQVPQNKKSF